MKPSFILLNNSGQYVQHIANCISFSSAVSVGNTATVSATYTPKQIPPSILYDVKDARLAVVLSDNSFSYTDNIYLLNKWGKGISRIVPEIVLHGQGFENLLSRRVVLGDEDTTIGYKSGKPEDVMLEIVAESIGDKTGNPVKRSLVNKGLSFAPIQGLSSYTIEATVAWSNVLDTLRNLQQITKDNNNEFFYRIVPSLTGKFLFTVSKLAVNDRSSSSSKPIILPSTSPELVDIELTYDSENIVTNSFVNFSDNIGSEMKEYEKFQGNASIFARGEYYEQTSSEFTQEWDRIAQRVFSQNRPKYVLSGKINESKRFKYGRDWKMGTILTVIDNSKKIDVQVRGVGLEFQNGVFNTYGTLESVSEEYYGI